MKVVVIGVSGAEIVDIVEPTPQAHQVVVRVRGCGLNRSD